MDKKKYSHVGLVGRKQTAAFSLINEDNQDFRKHTAIFKFPEKEYFSYMYMIATASVEKAVSLNTNTVIYTINEIVDNTRAFYAAYKKSKGTLNLDRFAEKCVAPKRKQGQDKNIIDAEKTHLVSYFTAVAKTFTSEANVKFEKASEVDMLILNLPKGVTVKEGEVLTFKDGKARDNISVYGWNDFNKEKATVKYYKSDDGKKVYFIYKSDNTPIGKAKSSMLRYLWSNCPVNEKIVVEEFYRVA